MGKTHKYPAIQIWSTDKGKDITSNGGLAKGDT